MLYEVITLYFLEIGLNTDLEFGLDNIKNKVGLFQALKEKAFLKLQTKIYE